MLYQQGAHCTPSISSELHYTYINTFIDNQILVQSENLAIPLTNNIVDFSGSARILIHPGPAREVLTPDLRQCV
jgi:hypothetical protein